MSNRIKALADVSWNEETKKKVRDAIENKAYHSSENSETEDESDSDNPPDNKKRVIAVRPLPWQRTRLTTVKTELDSVYLKGLSSRAKGMVSTRKNRSLSSRPVPKNAHQHMGSAIRSSHQ